MVLQPRETLVVLDHLVESRGVSPGKASHDLHIGINTWYRAIFRLESLELVAVTRAPGGKKIRAIVATPAGRQLAVTMARFEGLVSGSRAALEWELGHNPPPDGSEAAGEVLCRLIEHAERRGDLAELRRLELFGRTLGRAAEAALAGATAAFLTGGHAEAESKAAKALKKVAPDLNSRTYRKALFVLSGSKEYLGKPQEAILAGLSLRRAARMAGDLAMEADASLAIAVLKARRDNLRDAARDMRRALACAEKGAELHRKAKILSNLCLVEFLTDPDGGEGVADEALKASRAAGSRIAMGRVQMNRALMFAWRRKRREAEKAMREARRHFKEGGEEKGKQALSEWGRLVQGTLDAAKPITIEQLRKNVNEFVKSQGLLEPAGKAK